MRTAFLIGALLLGAAAAAEDFYRWTDERGVVHYTNHHPAAGAELVALPDLPTPPPQPRSYVEEWDWAQTFHPEVGVHMMTEERGQYRVHETR